jgi:GDP-L-fucose synthase
LGRWLADREFLADDAVEGILLATERYNGAEPVNPDAARKSGSAISPAPSRGTPASAERSSGTRASRTDSRAACARHAPRRGVVRLRAGTSMDEGLTKTIAWYREHRPVTAQQ